MGEADGPGALMTLSRGRRDPAKPSFMASGEDANPMNRRLPAEVVSRRRRPEKAVKEPEPVEDIQVDLKVVLGLKPEARPKWLGKAVRAAEDGRASTYDLYNVVTSRKFAVGLPRKVGKKLASIVREHLGLFSDKQQRYLRSEECALMSSFTDSEAKGDGGRESGDEKPDTAARMEEMMARCRAFVREKADTFGERITEAQDKERQAQEEATLAYERGRFEAEDERTRQRAREAEERSRREAVEAEEQARREAIEREHRKRRMETEAEELKKRQSNEEQARKRQLEDEVDNSLMLLERLKRDPTPEPQHEPVKSLAPSTSTSTKRKRGLSRSRSISVVAARRKRSRSSCSQSRGGSKKGHAQKSRARSKASRSRSKSKHRSKSKSRKRSKSKSRKRSKSKSRKRSKSKSRKRSASRSKQRRRRASSSSSHHHARKKKKEKSKKRRQKSSSSSKDSGKHKEENKKDHKEALQKRMKQWESEENLQRNLWGWANS